ncbi:MAG: ribonuclease E inhibitor RraB, partial [Erysipelotrichaceae bacterium]|nr:ribonuclease E inhibitor RraB [Erysipelotrichaceae bacterium]
RVAIEHHVRFSEVEDLFVFAQIIRQSGYHVKEGTEDKTLIVVREMFVDNNTILHDVFKVANQVYCLSGEYQKFRITKR